VPALSEPERAGVFFVSKRSLAPAVDDAFGADAFHSIFSTDQQTDLVYKCGKHRPREQQSTQCDQRESTQYRRTIGCEIKV
jgi:hypothetical protein